VAGVEARATGASAVVTVARGGARPLPGAVEATAAAVVTRRRRPAIAGAGGAVAAATVLAIGAGVLGDRSNAHVAAGACCKKAVWGGGAPGLGCGVQERRTPQRAARAQREDRPRRWIVLRRGPRPHRPGAARRGRSRYSCEWGALWGKDTK